MKKLLAWMLALLLTATPLAALAGDAYALRLSWEMDDSAVVSLFQDVPAEEAKALALLVNSMGYQLQWQPDAISFSMSMKDESILEASLAQKDGILGITGSVMPGIVMTLSEEQVPSRLFSERTNSLLTNTLSSLWTEINALWSDFLAALEPIEETGHFVGNAYANGVRRTLYCVDDRDISLLLNGVVDIIAKDSELTAWCDVLDISLADVARQAREQIRAVSLENEYCYEISFVYDATDELMGISATALKREEQVATLSAGFQENMLEIVLGCGIEHVNYYLRYTLMQEQNGATWYLRLISDPAHAGYDAVADEADAALLNAYGYYSVLPTEQGHDISLVSMLSSERLNILQNMQGHYTAEPFEIAMMEQNYINDTETPYLTKHWQISETEPLQTDWSAYTPIDLMNMSEQDSALMEQVVQKGATSLTVKLIRLLPSELLTYYFLMNNAE